METVLHENIGPIIRKIRKKKGFSMRDLCEKIGMNHGMLSQIENEKIVIQDEWLDKIDKELGVWDVFMSCDYNGTYEPPKKKKSYPFGVNNPQSIFNMDEIRKIREIYDSKSKTIRQIARDFGVSYHCIRKIVLRISYPDKEHSDGIL